MSDRLTVRIVEKPGGWDAVVTLIGELRYDERLECNVQVVNEVPVKAWAFRFTQASWSGS